MLLPEVQPLLARGSRCLPPVLLVDCGSIARWVAETDPSSDPWPLLIEALQRTWRLVCCVVAPTAKAHHATDPDELVRLWHRLQAQLPGRVGWSTEPAGALAAHVGSRAPLAIVSAGLTERPYELWPLARGVKAVFDVAAGRGWSPQVAEAEFGDLVGLPARTALTLPEPGEKPLVREALGHADAIDQQAPRLRCRELLDMFDAKYLAERVFERICEQLPALVQEERERRGDGRSDPAARVWVEGSGGAKPAPAASDTLYLAASCQNGRLSALAVGAPWHRGADDHVAGVALLRDIAARVPTARWVTPRALDLLDVLADEQISPPGRVVDPALGAFILHPDEPPPLEDLLDEIYALPVGVRAQLNDVHRQEAPLDARHLADVLHLLPALDQSVSSRLQQVNLRSVLEDDVACTLSPLAIIERQGIWVATPPGGWAEELQRHRQQLQPVLEQAARFLGRDPLRTSLDEIVHRLKRECGLLPATHWTARLEPKEEFERYVALGFPDAVAIQEVRSALSEDGVLKWLGILAGGATLLRGSLHPGVTGRWYYRDLPLGNRPKHSEWAKDLHQYFVAPPGMHLVCADWNGFEARLLASVTDDPVLTEAASAPDFHRALGEALGVSRDDAKDVIYSVVYGQQRAGFQRAQAGMSLADSGRLYDLLVSTVPAARGYRQQVLKEFTRRGEVRTHNGWCRIPVDPERWKRNSAATNLPIQGLSADILRWVLRRLAYDLPRFKAHLVHQLHDEVVVACPPAAVTEVTTLLETTMNDGVNSAGLLPRPVPLPVKIKDGPTWRDLL